MADTELSARQLEEQKERLLGQLNENEKILMDMDKRQKKRRREIEDINAKIKRTRNRIGDKDKVVKNLERSIESELSQSDMYEKSIIDALKDLAKTDGTIVSHEEGVKFLIDEMQRLHRTEAISREDRFERLRELGMDEIKTVKIFLGGLEFKDYASFRVSAEYTFDQLLSDACLYFSKSKAKCTLRNECNELWPRQARIQDHLREVISRQDPDREYFPQFRLVEREMQGLEGYGDISLRVREENETLDARRKKDLMALRREQLDAELAVRRKVYGLKSSQTPVFFHEREYMNYNAPELIQKLSWHNENTKTNEQEYERSLSGRLEWHLVTCTLHVLFLVAVFWSLIIARGQVYEFNDMRIWLHEGLTKPFSVTSDVSGSYASSVSVESLTTMDHVWKFLKGPMLDTLLPEDSDFETKTSTHANQVLGSVQIRQLRTASTFGTSSGEKCRGISGVYPSLYWMSSDTEKNVLQSSTLSCYNAFTGQLSDETSYWNDTTYTNDVDDASVDAYTYQSSVFEYIRVDDALFIDAGFALDLGTNKTEATTRLTNLESTGWIDRSTRVVLVQFNALNRNYQNMITGVVSLRFRVSGSINFREEVHPWRLTSYAYDMTSSNRFAYLIVCDVAVFLYGIYTLSRVIRGVKLYTMKKYVETLWNVVDVAICLTVFLTLSYRLLWTFASNQLPDTQSEIETGEYELWVQRAQHFRRISLCQLFVFLFGTLNTLRFFQLNVTLSKFYRVFILILADLGAWAFCVVIILIAVSLSIYANLSVYDDHFSSFSYVFGNVVQSTFDWRVGFLTTSFRENHYHTGAFVFWLITTLIRFCIARLLFPLFLSGLFRLEPDRHADFTLKRSNARYDGEDAISLSSRTLIFWRSFLLGPFRFLMRKMRSADTLDTLANVVKNK